MKTWEAQVMVQNGNARINHTARVSADTVFSAQQLLSAQYGANNVMTQPTEVTSGGSDYNASPWMLGL